jgi:hypothetical protein
MPEFRLNRVQDRQQGPFQRGMVRHDPAHPRGIDFGGLHRTLTLASARMRPDDREINIAFPSFD